MNPTVATVSACSKKSKIKKKPFFDDCRWKTQNVVVEGNVLPGRTRQRSHPAVLERLWLQWALLELRHVSTLVAVQGGDRGEGHHLRTEQRVAEQRLHRRLAFRGEETGNVITWDEWRSAPYDQDAGSSMNGAR